MNPSHRHYFVHPSRFRTGFAPAQAPTSLQPPSGPRNPTRSPPQAPRAMTISQGDDAVRRQLMRSGLFGQSSTPLGVSQQGINRQGTRPSTAAVSLCDTPPGPALWKPHRNHNNQHRRHNQHKTNTNHNTPDDGGLARRITFSMSSNQGFNQKKQQIQQRGNVFEDHPFNRSRQAQPPQDQLFQTQNQAGRRHHNGYWQNSPNIHGTWPQEGRLEDVHGRLRAGSFVHNQPKQEHLVPKEGEETIHSSPPSLKRSGEDEDKETGEKRVKVELAVSQVSEKGNATNPQVGEATLDKDSSAQMSTTYPKQQLAGELMQALEKASLKLEEMKAVTTVRSTSSPLPPTESVQNFKDEAYRVKPSTPRPSVPSTPPPRLSSPCPVATSQHVNSSGSPLDKLRMAALATMPKKTPDPTNKQYHIRNPIGIDEFTVNTEASTTLQTQPASTTRTFPNQALFDKKLEELNKMVSTIKSEKASKEAASTMGETESVDAKPSSSAVPKVALPTGPPLRVAEPMPLISTAAPQVTPKTRPSSSLTPRKSTRDATAPAVILKSVTKAPITPSPQYVRYTSGSTSSLRIVNPPQVAKSEALKPTQPEAPKVDAQGAPKPTQQATPNIAEQTTPKPKKRRASIAATLFPDIQTSAKLPSAPTPQVHPKPNLLSTTTILSPPPPSLPSKPVEQHPLPAKKRVLSPPSHPVQLMDSYIPPPMSPAFTRAQIPKATSTSTRVHATVRQHSVAPTRKRLPSPATVKAVFLRTNLNANDEVRLSETAGLVYYKEVEEEDLDTFTLEWEDYSVWRKTGAVP